MKYLILLIALTLTACNYEDLQFDETDFNLDNAFTYNYVATNPGDTTVIDSTTYRTYKVPLVDKYNGNYYHLTLLSSNEVSIEAERLNEINITPNNFAPSRLVYIDTYPALIHENCSFGVSMGVSIYCESKVVMKIDSLIVTIYIEGTTIDSSQALSGFDYTLSYSPDLTPYDYDAHIDNYIDYIKVDVQ